MKVAEMNNLDEEFWVMLEAGSKDVAVSEGATSDFEW